MAPIEVHDQTLASFHGKTVLITGGASGIGLETGKLFQSLGANVVLADLNEPRGFATQALSLERVTFTKCDITDWSSMLDAFEVTSSITGRIDVVCANAGINDMQNVFYNLPKDADGRLQKPNLSTMKVNLEGCINTISLAFHHMASKGGGSVVVTASMAGYLGLPEMPIYAATKHGLVGLMRSLKTTCVSKNISISLVAPGMTPTPILASLPDVKLPQDYSQEDLDGLYNNIRNSGVPANRTETVARSIVYLASSGLKTNGQGLLVVGDEVRGLEDTLIASWPEWLLDATDFIRNPSNVKVYDPKTGGGGSIANG